VSGVKIEIDDKKLAGGAEAIRLRQGFRRDKLARFEVFSTAIDGNNREKARKALKRRSPPGLVGRNHLMGIGLKASRPHGSTNKIMTLLRKILLCAGVLSMAARLPAQDQRAEVVKIQVDPNTILSHISAGFLGFGYETSAVAQTNFFNPRNATMVRLYRNLSTNGLIRVGGIISDHTKFVPDGVPVAQTQKGVTIINQTNLADLGGFARATGWKVMWGLNLGTGSKGGAAQEAAAVSAALGGSLQSFEIGNEVENLLHDYNAYHAAYVDYKSAIRAVLPEAPFSGPDSVGNWRYVTNFVATESEDMKLITMHYYRGGAGNTNATLARLLRRDTNWDKKLGDLRQLSRARGLAYRINEVNSFSGGGKKGVSDTFGSALWCLDYLFILASYECEGVNMETDINQLGFISHYSPIVHDEGWQCQARPEYYGLLAFSLAARGEVLKLTLEKSAINLSAYATVDLNGPVWITIINKDFVLDAATEINLPEGYNSASAFRLSAPAMESKDHVTLAGAEVSSDGSWTPGPAEKVSVTGEKVQVLVPHASALLLQLRRH
jgi:hypothetical protein